MSKKKNTLKDLDEFLKQQAATLVSPQKLTVEKVQPHEESPESANDLSAKAEVTIGKIISDLQSLAGRNEGQFRKHFYDLIIQTLESQTKITPADMVLINTALYLQHGSRWKEMIRQYWKEKKPPL